MSDADDADDIREALRVQAQVAKEKARWDRELPTMERLFENNLEEAERIGAAAETVAIESTKLARDIAAGMPTREITESLARALSLLKIINHGFAAIRRKERQRRPLRRRIRPTSGEEL